MKCTVCGGELAQEKGKLWRCKHCNAAFWFEDYIPEKTAIRLNNGNDERLNYYFDDALEKYELVLREEPELSEANWGALLSFYGIRYEEDRERKVYIPTCYRLREISVEQCAYFRFLTEEQKAEAKKLEALRRNILKVAKSIPSYDVFICYKRKERDDKTDTRESAWGRAIYERLVKKRNLNVFFAEISLEGSNREWEPHIYSALRSAKLMFVLADSEDHVKSAWVKNEWKRFAQYIVEGEEKVIRTVYGAVKPTDLVRELRATQAIGYDGGKHWLDVVERAAIEACRPKERMSLDAVALVQKAIENIGAVTVDSEAQIKEARRKFDGLTKEQKRGVDEYKLLNAEKAYDEIKKIYDAETAIGRIHPKLDRKERKKTFKNAQKAYRALTSDQREKLVNGGVYELEKKYYDKKSVVKACVSVGAGLATLGLLCGSYFVAIYNETLKDGLLKNSFLCSEVYFAATEKDGYTENICFLERFEVEVPTREGYRFLGYFDADDGAQYTDENGRSLEAWKEVNVSIRMTAHWELIDVPVAFYDEDGSPLLQGSVNVESGYKVTFELPELEKDGYVFVGWRFDGELIDVPMYAFTDENAEYALYAQWLDERLAQPYPLTVRYVYEDGGEAAETYCDSEAFYFGNSYSVPSPVLDGYRCDIEKVEGVMPAEAVTITVTYKKIHTLSYDFGGGEASGVYTTEYVRGETVTLPTVERAYHVFDDWYSDELFKEKADGEKLTKSPETLTLYAKWTPIKYTLSYDFGGGEVNGEYTTEYVYGETLSLPALEKEYYRFDGWYEDAAYKTAVTAEDLKTAPKNVALYAKWKIEDKYDFDFRKNADGASYTVGGLGRVTETDVVIPHTYEGLPVTAIGWMAFFGKTQLTSVSMPDSITTIGQSAFWKCASLRTVDIPDSVTTIGANAFDDCINLTSIELGYSVTEIGDSAFGGCSKLIEVYNKSVLDIGCGDDGYGKVALYTKNVYREAGGNKLSTDENGYVLFDGGEEKYFVDYVGTETELVLPDGVTYIYTRAFWLCEGMTSLRIPASVTKIRSEMGNSDRSCENAFGRNNRLSSIEVDDKNVAFKAVDGNLYGKDGKTLVKYAGGSSATSFTLPSGVEKIENGALAFSENLKSVHTGETVTTIGEGAFYDSDRLINVVVGDPVTTVGAWSFAYCDSLTNVKLGAGVTNASWSTFLYASALTNITVSEDNANFSSIDGNLYNKTGTALLKYANGKTAQSFTVSETVTEIGMYAFAHCANLNEVILPENVTRIGRAAFQSCSGLAYVVFKTPSDWTVEKTDGTVALKAADLTDPEAAAKCFKDTYQYGDWYRDE